MAKHKATALFAAAPSPNQNRFNFPSNALRLFSCMGMIFSIFLSSASAQTSTQQYVYLSSPAPTSSLVSGFNKASQTGALSLVPGSPFSERLEGGLVAIDGQGKFFFVLNPQSDDISMFQIDPASGALSEVPGSPFAAPPSINPSAAPSQPISIATESSGKFLFVGYFSSGISGDSAIVSLSINTTGSSPVLLTVQEILTNSGGAPIQLLTDPKGLHLYVGLGVGPSGLAAGGAEVYSIDSTGALFYQGMADTLPASGAAYAIDPKDRFFFAGGSGSEGFLENCLISPVDGTAGSCSPILFLDTLNHPAALIAENSGQFLYVFQSGTNVVDVYSVNQTTGALTQVLAPLSGIQFTTGGTVADPMGPYIYSAQFAAPAVVHAYQVDQQTGALTEIAGSPFTSGTSASCCGGLAISGNTVQAVSGPAVSIFPSAASNFSAVVGATSPTQVFSIVNVGNQLLAINSISITGTNASSFSQTNTCLATLAPNASCSVSITFTPPATGTFTASLQIADNAPGTPQTLALTGTGVAPAPAVTFSATALSFPDTNQGASSPAQTLTVFSSGNTSLHISSVSLAGPNPSDFSFTNNCTAPLAPASNCTISLVFTPTAAGQRVADLMIADDALGSPQTIVLSGTGIAVVPALSLSPLTPSFPATTQGTSSAPQTVTVLNSGNASLLISSISLTGPNASEFSFSSNCTAPLAPGAGCTISVVFSPLASGLSTASLVITDDAPGSPQTVSLSATANPAFSVAPASGSSLSASISAGQTAQYQIQLTPGAGYSGTVTLSCSGAPLNATCQAPSSVSLANGAAATFTVSVATSGPAFMPPSIPFCPPPASRAPLTWPLALALLSFFILLARQDRALGCVVRQKRFALYGILPAALFSLLLVSTGCGGGAASVAPITPPPPPPVVTPSGTSTITVTLSASSSSGQPLQLQPLQLTLTVK